MEVGENAVKRFGDYRLDTHKRVLYKGEDPISLMPKAFDLLRYLVENNSRVVGKDELMEAVWPDTVVEESNLSQNISILRKVLGEKPAENRFIATVPGRGYKFVAGVTADTGEESTSSRSTPDDELPHAKQPSPDQSPGRSRFLIAGVAVALCLTLLVLVIYWNRSSSPNDTTVGPLRTIAVLPFKPLAQNERDETLELGMADTLISKLSESTELIVRPISSVRRFSSIDQDALEAGRQLGVEAVLDGSIQRSGDTIRVNVRLVGTNDGSSIWSATYDEPASDLFKLQDAISSRVAGALQIRLGKARAPYTSNLDAYRLYMTGRLQVLRATRPELLQGIQSFRRAIELDPNYALAYAGMADAYRTLALGGEMRPSEVFPEARAAAHRAVQLDDSLAEAHMVLGSTLFWCDWDWAGSEEQFKRALQLNPNIADTHSEYAFLLSNMGRHDEALTLIRTALQLDPLNVRTNARYGQFLNHAGLTNEALQALRLTMQLDRDYWLSYQFASSTHLTRREYREAFDSAEAAQRLNSESTRPMVYGGYAKARLGDAAGAGRTLDTLLSLSKERYVPNVNIAVLWLTLGEQEKALDSLELAFEEKDSWMTFLMVDPIWSEMKGNPRFDHLLRKMNFG